MSTAVAIAAIGLMGAGCGGGDGDPQPEPESTSGEAITYSKSGGIEGIAQRIEIEPDGSATIEIGYENPQTSTLRLSAAEFEEINATLDEAGFDSISSPDTDTGCADCFLYEVTRGDHTVGFDDVSFPDGLAPAVTELD